jgi:hypothetical protein
MVGVRHPPAAPYTLPHRYASVCRRVLADLEEAELSAAGDRAAPRGVLTVTAPAMFGTRILWISAEAGFIRVSGAVGSDGT